MSEFERVFRENRDYIFKYLMKLSRNAAVAEELTQETFFRAYMNYSALRDKTKVSIWLCQIAKNAYYAQYNDKKRTVPIEETEALGTSESEGALGGSTRVKVYKNDDIDFLILEIHKPKKDIYVGNWGALSRVEMHWQTDDVLIINDVEYDMNAE